VMPIPSTMSRVRRKGTISGVLRKRPCSNATPRSMWTMLAVRLWMRMLELCRSPSPMTWPGEAARLAINRDQGVKGNGRPDHNRDYIRSLPSECLNNAVAQ